MMDVKKIIENHRKWVENEAGGQCANLCNVNLRNIDLRRASLNYADLSGADISYSELNKICLHGANLREIKLCGSDLQGADLGSANLYYADLTNCNLSYSNLNCANLWGADLRGANLRGTALDGANFKNADLRKCYFRDAIFYDPNLSGATMDKTYYQVARVGRLKGSVTYCVDDDIVLCGDWNNFRGGSLAAFEKRIIKKYGITGQTPNELYFKEYMAAIKFFASMGNKE